MSARNCAHTRCAIKKNISQIVFQQHSHLTELESTTVIQINLTEIVPELIATGKFPDSEPSCKLIERNGPATCPSTQKECSAISRSITHLAPSVSKAANRCSSNLRVSTTRHSSESLSSLASYGSRSTIATAQQGTGQKRETAKFLASANNATLGKFYNNLFYFCAFSPSELRH